MDGESSCNFSSSAFVKNDVYKTFTPLKKWMSDIVDKNAFETMTLPDNLTLTGKNTGPFWDQQLPLGARKMAPKLC